MLTRGKLRPTTKSVCQALQLSVVTKQQKVLCWIPIIWNSWIISAAIIMLAVDWYLEGLVDLKGVGKKIEQFQTVNFNHVVLLSPMYLYYLSTFLEIP